MAVDNSYYEDTDWTIQDFETPAEKAAKLANAVAQPGTCPKCGKHVGKGSFIHIKACNGHLPKAA